MKFLTEGSKVMIDDVQVGTIQNIDFVEGGEGSLITSLRIKSDVHLPGKSIARIIHGRNIQNKFVEIVLNTSEDYYQFGDTIETHEFRLSVDSLVDLSHNVMALMEGGNLKSQLAPTIIYAVQLFTSNDDIVLEPSNFKGLNGVYKYRENAMNKYVYGKKDNLGEVKELKLQLKNIGYKDAFIVVFRNGKRISISEID